MRCIRQTLFIFTAGILSAYGYAQRPAPGQHVYQDVAYPQKSGIKYELSEAKNKLQKIVCDRNGNIQILSSHGLLKPSGGALLYPGTLVADNTYKPMREGNLSDVVIYNDQFVYLDDKAILSNAWAGKLYAGHTLQNAAIACGGNEFSFLIAGGHALQYVTPSGIAWNGSCDEDVLDIIFDQSRSQFWILTKTSVFIFNTKTPQQKKIFTGHQLTCFALSPDNNTLILGTHQGYLVMDAEKGTAGSIHDKLPCNDITSVKVINGNYWFGSAKGAFMMRSDGKFDYYASQRWLPSDHVIGIAGNKESVFLLTDKGMGEIRLTNMTLKDKADFFEKQVRTRHIRNGFNATTSAILNGDPATGELEDSDNDGLWTAMYLGGEVFRYAVTRDPAALQNCRESMDAMERLYTIHPIKGFPARSYERRGYEKHDTEAWKQATDSNWDWKSTTSSDEAIGHIFVFGVTAELVDDANLKSRAIRLIDALMQHIVDHDMYLVDWNGEPTKWGRWNPEYVNARPLMVGDRKITSSNIISMLQTAYHFTHKKIYKDKAFELMQKYGYLDNLVRPMKDISYAPAGADELSRELSEGWNHSDDEMYFLGYWGLYRYAFNDTLKTKFKRAIIDHWEAERPEHEAAWNIFTAMTGVKAFDLDESINYLRRYPLDLINWTVVNSQRKDIEFIPENFRRQTIREVLPPDESPIHRHNANLFELDGGDDGRSENSAGDIWLLPYWMGRWLGVISAPSEMSLRSINTDASPKK